MSQRTPEFTKQPIKYLLAGWFTLTVDEPHTAALPQLTALGAGVALWLSVLLAGGRGRR